MTSLLSRLTVEQAAQAAVLLQQAFAEKHAAPAGDEAVDKGKGNKLENIAKMSKPTSSEIPESSVQAEAKENGGKVPYCYRCLTKGHVIKDCIEIFYCDICDCDKHSRERCPLFRQAKVAAIPYGYAVEGLGFYYIPHNANQR